MAADVILPKVVQNNPAASPKASAILGSHRPSILTAPIGIAFQPAPLHALLMNSVFSTPLVTPLLRLLAAATLRLTGWKANLDGIPAPPYILIGAPHTSNWDFLLMLGTLLQLKQEARWLGKTSLFTPPFGTIMRWLGGIPVDRSQPQNAVAASVKVLKAHPGMILCVAPEGTRKKVTRWRTGFYYIALEADLPIVMIAIDAVTRTITVLGLYKPSGDFEREIGEIKRRYKGFTGIIPENTCELVDP